MTTDPDHPDAAQHRVNAEFLASTALFRGVSQSDLIDLVGSVQELTFQPGEVILEQDQVGAGLFLIVEGYVEVIIRADEARSSASPAQALSGATAIPTHLGLLRPGEPFGEMSLLDGEPAVASVTAASQLRCLYVPRADFLQMLASHAAVGSSVVRLLVQRLRDADRRVAATAADPLTGLSNRLGLEQQCRREGGRLARYGGSLAVLFADVDKFKAINDTFGHPAGDDVLRLVADSLRRSLRASDFAARFGGDEFVALLPDTDAGGARLLADRFRDDLDALTDLPVPMSVSIGLRDMHIPPLELSDADETSFPEQLDQRASDVNGRLAEIMGAADKAMYESKARQRAGAQASGPQHD